MKKVVVLSCVLLVGVVCAIPMYIGAQEDQRGPTKSPRERMEQWNEWKFGMFIHWGPWSQTHKGPIFRGRGNHEVSGRQQLNEYLALNKTFNPVKFDPSEWARIAKKAGMQYVVPITKHHDGFCLFDTQLTDYKITNPECPWSKSANPDIICHLLDAFRKEGFAIGVYYSHPDQHHPDGLWWSRHFDYIPNFKAEHPDRWKSFVAFEQGQVRELLTNYGHIDIFWFDIKWPEECLRDAIPMLKMMRELQPHLIINNRGTSEYSDFETPEQKVPGKPPKDFWETNMTVSGTSPGWSGFWYKGPEARYKRPEEIVQKLCDICSKGGNFLLNIGPKPDGTIPQGEIDTLLGVGKWMDVNSEAIYGTKRSPWGAAPQWGRITIKGQRIYLIVFDWPEGGGKIPLALKFDKITKASLLKDGTPVEFSAVGNGVEFSLPAEKPTEYASVIAVDFDGELGVTAKWPQPKQRKKK